VSKGASQILQEARARLAARWIQGSLMTVDSEPTPGYCLLGSLPRDEKNPAVRAVVQLLFTLSGDPSCRLASLNDQVMALIGWNDHPFRTQEEVLALFDQALEEATK
jgi:hypothetical protein